MAEEGTRRSARSTKGQHTKPLDEATPQPPPKATKGKKKQVKEEVEDVIRCVCGNQEDDGELAFIQCDQCDVWQHNVCMGITEDEDEAEKLDYACEKCKPEAHKELLDAMKRGERPWEERNGQKSRKKKGQKKGKATKSSQTASKQSPSPASGGQTEDSKNVAKGQNEGTKRKRSDVEVDDTAAPTTKARKPVEPPAKVKKGSQSEQKQSKPLPENKTQAELTQGLDGVRDDNRKRIATDLKKRFSEKIKEASGQRRFRIPDEHTADSLAESCALRVEHAMFITHAGKDGSDFGGPYKAQYMAIRSNISKNTDLLLGLVNGSITPTMLASMSSKDMASEEQKQRDEMIKKENEKQAILMKDEGASHIRRTHKGEEVVDDSANHFTGDSISSVAVPRRRESAIDEEESSPIDKGRNGDPLSPSAHSPSFAPSPPQRRQSSSFDIQGIWRSGGSPNGESVSRRPQPINTNTSQTRTQNQQNHDADIDRLLNEDDYSAPYSPADNGLDANIFWRGTVDMPIDAHNSIANFSCGAHLIAGSDLSNRLPLSEIYPSKLEIHGRIPALSADNYLGSLSAGRGLDVTVHNLIPDDNRHDHEEFDKLYEYLLNRQRFGVISEKTHRPYVRDSYIIPIEAGASKMPDFLERLASNAIEQPRPSKMLLIVFVMKWPPESGMSPKASQPPRASVGAGTPQAAPAMSPTSAGGSTQMPYHFQQQGGTASGQLPGNPYETSQHRPGMSATPPQFPTGMPSAQPDPYIRIREILGEYADTPVTKQLVGSAGGLQLLEREELLLKLKKVYEDHPEARTDFDAFQRYLSQP